MALQRIEPTDAIYPAKLNQRLGKTPALLAVGSEAALSSRKVALFCSAKCPGAAILAAYDYARQLRDEGKTVIGGFHSPIEKECLRILLRGKQPIIICPARSLEGMRLPTEWKQAIDQGRLLLLSPFPTKYRRITAVLAQQRNDFVAALADEVWFAHITPAGQMEQLSQRVSTWGIRKPL